MKTCSQCKKLFDFSFFHKNKKRKDGYHEYCKECRKQQYIDRDREKAIARSAATYATKKEKCLEQMKKYYEQNQESKKAYGRQHYQNNKYKYISNASNRKLHIKTATPPWFSDFDLFVLQEAHHLCKLREQMIGFPWDVDHKIPLRGKTVCGLHVKENIAVIPRKQNNFKRAKFVENPVLFPEG